MQACLKRRMSIIINHPHHKARPWSSSSSLKGRLRSHPLLRRGFFSKSTASCNLQGMLLDSRHRRHTTEHAHFQDRHQAGCRQAASTGLTTICCEYRYIPADPGSSLLSSGTSRRGQLSQIRFSPRWERRDIHGFSCVYYSVLLSNVDRGLVQLHRHTTGDSPVLQPHLVACPTAVTCSFDCVMA